MSGQVEPWTKAANWGGERVRVERLKDRWKMGIKKQEGERCISVRIFMLIRMLCYPILYNVGE